MPEAASRPAARPPPPRCAPRRCPGRSRRSRRSVAAPSAASSSAAVAMVDNSSSDPDRPCGIPDRRATGRQSGAIHPDGNQLVDLRRGSRLADRSRSRAARARRGADRGAARVVAAWAGSRSRTITPITTEAVGRCGRRSRRRPLAAFRGQVDVPLRDGDRFGPLEAVATPGHAPDHLAFVAGRACFTGDAVLGQGSVFIAPDPGALAGYLEGLGRLRARDLAVLCPGHGPVVTDPAAKLDEYVSHRLERERRLLDRPGRRRAQHRSDARRRLGRRAGDAAPGGHGHARRPS